MSKKHTRWYAVWEKFQTPLREFIYLATLLYCWQHSAPALSKLIPQISFFKDAGKVIKVGYGRADHTSC